MNEIKGLVRKDWQTVYGQFRVFFIFIFVLIAAFSYVIKDSGSSVSFFIVNMVLLSVICFAFDERVDFGKLVAASPLSTVYVVLARYAFASLVAVGGGAIMIFINSIILTVHRPAEASFSHSLSVYGEGLAAAVLLVSVIFPIIYKFGANKSNILLFYIIPSLIYMAATLFHPGRPKLPDGFWNALPFVLAVFLIFIFVVSIRLSIRILKNKEY